jgi:hypothetical protein
MWEPWQRLSEISPHQGFPVAFRAMNNYVYIAHRSSSLRACPGAKDICHRYLLAGSKDREARRVSMATSPAAVNTF